MPTSPGIVFSLRFVQASAAEDKYSRYAVGYLSRPQAFEGYGHESDPLYHDADPRKDQYGYMSNEDKTDGLFDFEKDIVNDYGKMLHTKIFDFSQQQDCPLYQGVISFRNDFLRRHNIDYASVEGLKQLKQIARLGISELIHESHIREDNVDWTAAIHTNTDNIHIHFAIIELQKVNRTYDMLEVKAFDKLKSRVANRIVGNEEKIKLSQIYQYELPKEIKEALHCTGTQIQQLADALPTNIPWQYNRPGMTDYHDMIDACVDKIIASNSSLTDMWERGKIALQKYDTLVREMYGDAEHTSVYDQATGTWGLSDRSTRGLADEAAKNKLRDFYSRAGNAVLHAAKEYQQSKLSSLREYAANVAAARPAGEKSEMDSGMVYQQSDNRRQITAADYYPDIPDMTLHENATMPRPAGEKSKKHSSHHKNTDRVETPEDDTRTQYTKTELIAGAEKNDPYAQYQLGKMYLYGKGMKHDLNSARLMFQSSADMGNYHAAYELAKFYRDGIGVEQNDILTEMYFYQAFKGFAEKESNTGSPQAEYRIGIMYLNGEGCPIDAEKAQEYLQGAADKGHAYAQYMLGKLYLDGKRIKRNAVKAYDLLSDAAVNGNRSAQYLLANLLISGKEFEKDEKLGFRLMKLVSDENDPYAAVKMYKLCRDGIGTDQDMVRARYYRASAKIVFRSRQKEDLPDMVDGHYAVWTKEYYEARQYYSGSAETERDFDMAMVLLEVESERGNAYATYDLARMYMEGLSVDVDREKADKLYSNALQAFLLIESTKHDPYIQYRIGKMFRDGKGTEKNFEKAAEYYQKSADQNNPFAQYALGKLLFTGIDVEKDVPEAISLLTSSAGQNNEYAQYMLGKIYLAGEYVAADEARGFRMIRASADQGNAYAAYAAAELCQKGIGTEKSESTANRYFSAAYSGFVDMERETHDDSMQLRLANMLASGEGCGKNIGMAIDYYEKSSRQNNQFAQYALGRHYLNEKKMDGNYDKAKQLLKASATQGNQFAQCTMGHLYRHEGKTQKALQMYRSAAAQGNTYAKEAISQITHPAGYRVKSSALSSLRALTAVSASARRLTNEYEKRVDELIREYDYEQSYEQSQTRSV